MPFHMHSLIWTMYFFIRAQYSVTPHFFRLLVSHLAYFTRHDHRTGPVTTLGSHPSFIFQELGVGLSAVQTSDPRRESIDGVDFSSKVPSTINGAVSPLPSERAPLH